MKKHTRKLLGWVLFVFVLLVFAFLARDFWFRSPHRTTCPDGPHDTMDLRDFSTRYFAYGIKFEAQMGTQGRLALNLDPVQLQQLSEHVQQASEFRKLLVAGYNSCIFTSAQFARFAITFQNLDHLERELVAVAQRPTPTPTDREHIAELLSQIRSTASDMKQ